MLRSLRCFVLVSWSALSLAGCFLDRSPLGGEDASVGCGQCPAGQACVDGECRSTAVDQDEDGVPAEGDCDDADAAVGANAERACPGDCGDGIERCLDGTWGACDAPADCDCEIPGTTQTVGCSMCGEKQQRCGDDRRWADAGECTGTGECVADADETESMPCGLCGEGRQTRTRTCSTDCAWGEWSEWGACTGETAECPADLEEVETQSCGSACGTQTRTRTCSDTCGWGAWSEWGDCTEPTDACVPGEIDTEEEDCPCGSGSSSRRTRTRTCESTCAWGAWSEWTACVSGECVAGTTETGAATFCGSCGSQRPTRTCTGECTWGAWTPGTCSDTRCRGAFGGSHCACDSTGGWTCCPDGDWSGWLGSCSGCP